MTTKERVPNPSEGGSYVRLPDGTCELKKRGKTEALVNGHPDHEKKVIAAAEEAERKEKANKQHAGAHHAPRGDK